MGIKVRILLILLGFLLQVKRLCEGSLACRLVCIQATAMEGSSGAFICFQIHLVITTS